MPGEGSQTYFCTRLTYLELFEGGTQDLGNLGGILKEKLKYMATFAYRFWDPPIRKVKAKRKQCKGKAQAIRRRNASKTKAKQTQHEGKAKRRLCEASKIYILGCFKAILGHPGYLGRILGNLGAIFGFLRQSWTSWGASWDPFWANLGLSWAT